MNASAFGIGKACHPRADALNGRTRNIILHRLDRSIFDAALQATYETISANHSPVTWQFQSGPFETSYSGVPP